MTLRSCDQKVKEEPFIQTNKTRFTNFERGYATALLDNGITFE